MKNLDDEIMDEALEEVYERGSRAAWRMVLQAAMLRLGADDSAGASARWVIEREEAVAALRDVCGDYGDNDWPNRLRLADVIEKHLARHLGAKE